MIPATKTQEMLYAARDEKKRVAAYCRVSADSEEQLNSYEAQKNYYIQKIEDNPDWDMIDFICSAEGQTALAAAQKGTLRYTNSGYTAPEGAWLKPSGEITWVDRDVEYLTANKDAILEYWNSLLADVHG